MYQKNPYYHTCPLCGANLDPGEKCDCESHREEKQPESGNVTEKCNKIGIETEGYYS